MESLKDVIGNKLNSIKIHWITTGEDWILSQCPNPKHEDKQPSMFINTKQGYGKCQSCGFVVNPKFFGADSDEDINEVFRNSTFLKVIEDLEKSREDIIEQKPNVFLPPRSKELTEPYRGLPLELLKLVDAYICEKGRYKNRIIFPFYNARDELIGFTARKLSEDVNFPNAKYLHSTGLVTNQDILLGRLIRDLKLDMSKGLVFTEGNLCAMSLCYNKVPTTPLLGFKVPTTQLIIQAIELEAEQFILAFDNDEVGLSKMFHKDKEQKDLSIYKYWKSEYKTILGFYSEYELVKKLYKSHYKDFHEMIYEH